MRPWLPIPAAARSNLSASGRSSPWLVGLLTLVVLHCGCGSNEEIRSYTVPKREILYAANHVQPDSQSRPSEVDPAEPTDRLLGGIVSNGQQTWYFKLAGPLAAVGKQEAAFRQWIGSMRFADDQSAPQWELPPSWVQSSDAGQPLPAVSVEVDGIRLPLSVIQLATGSAPEAILDHVNRWRQQMRLATISLDELATQTTAVPVAGGTAILVNLMGRYVQDPSSHSLRREPADRSSADNADAWVRYTAPPDWNEEPPPPFSQLAFGVGSGPRKVTITVSLLRGEGGGVLANFNRWRQQVGLPPITDQQLAESVESITVDGVAGQYLEAAADGENPASEAIYGWIGLQQDRSWFVRLRGNAQLAAEQRTAFRDFLKSIQFTETDGSENGG